MTQHQTRPCSAQEGFTLVELAIVMIIIGLLIAGVLKGQALISNAQVTATVAQIKAIDAATTTFRDQYNFVPGDIGPAPTTPATVIPNCTTGNCAQIGNGDGKVNNSGGAAGNSITFGAGPANEQLAYWAQLNAAGLLTGINPPVAVGTAGGWNAYAPSTKVAGGGYDIGWYAGGIGLAGLQNATAASPAPAGEYLAMHGNPGAAVGGLNDAFMTPNIANRIDTKIDDGSPNTGTVLAAGAAGAGAAGCASAGTATATYNQSLTTAVCDLYVKFQN